MDRTVLPIPEPKRPVITEFDARKAAAPPRFEVKAPANAPNVLLVLIDDMGFGMSSAFGGPIHMQTVERLADNGLRYNHFHTTVLCSPTCAALLSGRNHHMNNMGAITEFSTAFPGNRGRTSLTVYEGMIGMSENVFISLRNKSHTIIADVEILQGGIGTILVNGQKVAEGRIEHTQCCFFSADEGADVGMDDGTPVTEDYKEHDNKFTGTINKVTIELTAMKAANPEEEQRVVREAHVGKQLAD
ncbi:MAG: sulfatase-like hydrolase/transferase [Nitrospirae bacterium]|nr:sulfatase-like hydrolase/transferase [Nitrospirota bacterium]